MEDVAIQKRTVTNRIFDFIEHIFKLGKKKKTDITEYSRFRYFLRNINKDSIDYEPVASAVAICDEAIIIAEKRINLIEKLKKTDESIQELECYNNLSPDDVAKAKDLLDRYTSLSRDRNNLRNQLDGFERSLSFMSELEDEAADAVSDINEAEEKQRLFKQDLGYLEGERADLVYERERFEAGLSFIQKFSVGMCIFFSVATAALTFMYIINGTNILLPMFTLVGLVVIISSLLFAFRRRINYEMEINLKKQSRAVELINKKTVLYAHYTNFLNYEYKKFKIRNSEMLKDNLHDYGLYKYLIGRLDSIRNIMYQTESEIEEFFKEKDIFNSNITVEKFAQTIDLDNKKSYYSQLITEKAAIEKNLSIMDIKHERLWDALSELSEKDTSEERLIQHIIKSYMDEAGKLIMRSSTHHTATE